MAENGTFKWTVVRVKKGVKEGKTEIMEFEVCPLCGAKIPVKFCDEEKCEGHKLVHVCPKDKMNGEGINTYFYYCDSCKSEWFMQLIIVKKNDIAVQTV